MSYARIVFQESNVSRRIVYFPSIQSRTSPFLPVTTMAGSVVSLHRGGAAAIAVAATLAARDNTNGLYSVTLSQSECSVMGSYGAMSLLVSTTSSLPATVDVTITAVDSGDSMRYGMLALPNAAA